MALNSFQLAASGLDGGPKKKKPTAPPPAEPGLTGADLEMAHAQREHQTAVKAGIQGYNDFDALGGQTTSSAAMRALRRGNAENEIASDRGVDMANIRNLVAALHSHVNK